MTEQGDGRDGDRGSGIGSYDRPGLPPILSLVAINLHTMAFVAQASHYHLNLSNAYMAVVMPHRWG